MIDNVSASQGVRNVLRYNGQVFIRIFLESNLEISWSFDRRVQRCATDPLPNPLSPGSILNYFNLFWKNNLLVKRKTSPVFKLYSIGNPLLVGFYFSIFHVATTGILRQMRWNSPLTPSKKTCIKLTNSTCWQLFMNVFQWTQKFDGIWRLFSCISKFVWYIEQMWPSG